MVLALLSTGHFFIDLYSGALSALQPRLVEKHGLTLAQAGQLGGVLILSSSVLQPLYGYLSDRLRSPVFTILAPAVAGCFVSALGLAPSFGWLVAMILLGGVGIASFHPQASSWVTRGVGNARAAWMAVFISAGTLGMAVGPTYFSMLPAWWGLDNLHWAAIPGMLCSLLLWFTLGGTPAAAGGGEGIHLTALRSVWRPLFMLYLCVFIRSIVQVSYAQLLPLYLHRERGMPIGQASFTLSLYIAAGALGGVVGGRLADRIGGRRVIMISMIGSVPFLGGFFLTSGLVSTLCLLAGGLVLLFTIPVNIVMAQELVPGQTGTVSALMMGFAWGLAGLIFVPLCGWASDLLSMHQVLATLTLFPVLGYFCARRLP
jgi:FSR family fosmidomycin resistance protein-like MFS transporter